MEGRPTRKNVRLPDYDYSGPGYYFVTVCTKSKESVLGNACGCSLIPSAAGKIVEDIWNSLPAIFGEVSLDVFVLMPNHLHCVVVLNDNTARKMNCGCATNKVAGSMNRAPTLGEIVRRLKAISTRRVRQQADSGFSWQRNYYEHVIRSEDALDRIRRYVELNPLMWELDRYRPDRCALSRQDAVTLAGRYGLQGEDFDLCRRYLIL